MKILITGGAGFIGSHITQSLIEDGHEVIVYDNFSTGLMENLDQIKNERLEIINADILDFDSLNNAMDKVDIVSHHAAQLEIFVGIDEPEKDLSINTVGTLNVLKAAVNNIDFSAQGSLKKNIIKLISNPFLWLGIIFGFLNLVEKT